MGKPFSGVATAFLAAGLALGCASAGWHDPNAWKPDRVIVAQVDNLVLTSTINSDGPLANYTRYYWGTLRHGRRVIAGVLLAPWVEADWRGTRRSELGKVHILTDESAPMIGDGGCGQINVEYDIRSRSITRLFCNAELPPPPPPPPRSE